MKYAEFKFVINKYIQSVTNLNLSEVPTRVNELQWDVNKEVFIRSAYTSKQKF